MKVAAVDTQPTAAETCVDCKLTPRAGMLATNFLLRGEYFGPKFAHKVRRYTQMRADQDPDFLCRFISRRSSRHIDLVCCRAEHGDAISAGVRLAIAFADSDSDANPDAQRVQQAGAVHHESEQLLGRR